MFLSHFTCPNLLQILNAIAYLDEHGRTNTADAVKIARTQMFTASNGDRSGDDNIMIVITDGYSNVLSQNTIPEATTAKNNGIRLITVGLGQGANRGELEAMASNPVSENTHYLENESQLETVAGQILDRLCQ